MRGRVAPRAAATDATNEIPPETGCAASALASPLAARGTRLLLEREKASKKEGLEASASGRLCFPAKERPASEGGPYKIRNKTMCPAKSDCFTRERRPPRKAAATKARATQEGGIKPPLHRKEKDKSPARNGWATKSGSNPRRRGEPRPYKGAERRIRIRLSLFRGVLRRLARGRGCWRSRGEGCLRGRRELREGGSPHRLFRACR